MKVNTAKLKARMAEEGYSVPALSKAIGMNTATFYRHLQASGMTFRIGEVHKICAILRMEPSDATCIFLSDNSQKREN